MIESRDAIFDEHMFSSVPRPSQRSLKDGTEDSGGLVVFERVIEEMDVKTTFLNGELEEEVYMNQHMGFTMPGNENKIDLTKEFLSSRFSMKDMGEAYVILACTPMDTCEKLMPNKGPTISKLEYSRMIGWLICAMTCKRPDIAFYVGKLSRYTSNPGTQHWQGIQRVLNNTKDNSSTSCWVFLLGGGAISWASKKQTCIIGSTIESKFVAMEATGKEAECVATMAKAYSQMYNGNSRHLGVIHSMIHELIMNEVVSTEFMRKPNSLLRKLSSRVQLGKLNIQRVEAHVLQIIPRMFLEPAEKEDEVANFLMVNFFEKVLNRSMNKEEPPM
nr:hypothetical protein [Tanacetum cinerariifolium]